MGSADIAECTFMYQIVENETCYFWKWDFEDFKQNAISDLLIKKEGGVSWTGLKLGSWPLTCSLISNLTKGVNRRNDWPEAQCWSGLDTYVHVFTKKNRGKEIKKTNVKSKKTDDPFLPFHSYFSKMNFAMLKLEGSQNNGHHVKSIPQWHTLKILMDSHSSCSSLFEKVTISIKNMERVNSFPLTVQLTSGTVTLLLESVFVLFVSLFWYTVKLLY